MIHRHRGVAMLMLALTLLVKALVPAGVMVDGKAMVLTVTICTDGIGPRLTREISIPMKEASGIPAEQQKKAGDHCAYGALGHGTDTGAGPLLLAALLLFILTLGLFPQAFMLRSLRARLMPPMRGPPVFA